MAGRGEDEVTIQDALHDGIEERGCASESSEVWMGEERADDVNELDGETRERHCEAVRGERGQEEERI